MRYKFRTEQHPSPNPRRSCFLKCHSSFFKSGLRLNLEGMQQKAEEIGPKCHLVTTRKHMKKKNWKF